MIGAWLATDGTPKITDETREHLKKVYDLKINMFTSAFPLQADEFLRQYHEERLVGRLKIEQNHLNSGEEKKKQEEKKKEEEEERKWIEKTHSKVDHVKLDSFLSKVKKNEVGDHVEVDLEVKPKEEEREVVHNVDAFKGSILDEQGNNVYAAKEPEIEVYVQKNVGCRDSTELKRVGWMDAEEYAEFEQKVDAQKHPKEEEVPEAQLQESRQSIKDFLDCADLM